MQERKSADNVQLRFDFAGDGSGIPLVFSNPEIVLAAYRLDDVEAVLRRVDRERARGRFAAGFVGYEAAPAFDDALVTREPAGDLPLAWFGIFDSSDGGIEIIDSDEPAPPPVAWTPDVDRARFDRDIATIREAIADGDTYQVNYTFRLTAEIDPGRVRDLYRYLRRVHRPPYAAHLSIGRWQVLSLSPELFFRIDGGVISSRPMKGTAPRGLWEEDDRQQAARLASSAKDRSENVMIVDLVRNDVTRVAEIGTVRASSLFDLERYPSVWQMTSTVEGQLRAGASGFDVFQALFPAGSITGAPKSSAMRTIRALERGPRGVYTGAVGYFSPGGEAVFNVAIRTATIDALTGRATAGIGGGITWESSSGDEHAEAIGKAAFLEPPREIALLETMRLEAGVVVRLERHLARLAESAAFLDFECDIDAARSAVDGARLAHPDGTHRVRLRLWRFGAIDVAVTPMDAQPEQPAPVVLAEDPVSSRDRTLYHKTTSRAVYDSARAARGAAFDVLLWNERRELTEFTIGNLVVEIDGARHTPPRRSGLLAGVFRGELLDAGTISERVITIDDLDRASRTWLVNSLREWVLVDHMKARRA